MQLQFLAHLVGEPGQRRVVEIFTQHETLVAAVRLHVGGLAAEIDMVLRVDLKLRGDLGIEFAKSGPDARQIRDADFRIGQDLERRCPSRRRARPWRAAWVGVRLSERAIVRAASRTAILAR